MEQTVEKMIDYLNALHNDKDFCKAMGKKHRYLQNEFTGLCIEWLRYCVDYLR